MKNSCWMRRQLQKSEDRLKIDVMDVMQGVKRRNLWDFSLLRLLYVCITSTIRLYYVDNTSMDYKLRGDTL